jgi:hypothetical protein
MRGFFPFDKLRVQNDRKRKGALNYRLEVGDSWATNSGVRRRWFW